MKRNILFACFVLFHTASALECYSCLGPACETETKTWDKIICGASAANYQLACLKFSYNDRLTQKKETQRKCVLTELKKDGKLNYKCPRFVGDQIECLLCETDLCNSAKSINFSFMALYAAVIAIVASKLL